jgi:peptidoglycan L-alanyl-D-glutamate endopeptidase CwlK
MLGLLSFGGYFMPDLSRVSRNRLFTCHPDLQLLVMAVSKRISLMVVQGHRGKEEQNHAFTTGKSKLAWPFSKHNETPSRAVDLAPLNSEGGISWDDLDAFKEMGRIVFEEAHRLRIPIRWGGNFKTWKDYPHFELLDEGA